VGSHGAPRRRRWWRGPALGALLVGAALSADTERGTQPAGGQPHPGPGARLGARVAEVIDGDTVVVRMDDGAVERIRYIGIDTPESDPREPLECFGLRAKAANSRLVAERRVTLVVGAEPRDDYGRLLAYVLVHRGPGRSLPVNAELVRRGFARTLTIAPNDAKAPALRRLESAAGRAGRGLWGSCGT
jgi:micrococcal nuclease